MYVLPLYLCLYLHILRYSSLLVCVSLVLRHSPFVPPLTVCVCPLPHWLTHSPPLTSRLLPLCFSPSSSFSMPLLFSHSLFVSSSSLSLSTSTFPCLSLGRTFLPSFSFSLLFSFPLSFLDSLASSLLATYQPSHHTRTCFLARLASTSPLAASVLAIVEERKRRETRKSVRKGEERANEQEKLIKHRCCWSLLLVSLHFSPLLVCNKTQSTSHENMKRSEMHLEGQNRQQGHREAETHRERQRLDKTCRRKARTGSFCIHFFLSLFLCLSALLSLSWFSLPYYSCAFALPHCCSVLWPRLGVGGVSLALRASSSRRARVRCFCGLLCLSSILAHLLRHFSTPLAAFHIAADVEGTRSSIDIAVIGGGS